MHESFFGLQKRPFLAVPTLERYCPVASQEMAFQSCARAITRAEGPVAILGGTGLGKSMVCLRIGESFRRNFEVILLTSSQICSRRALLQSLLFELRMPYRDLSEGELRLSLLDRLQPSNENPSDGLVLIVDEAQTLSIKLLEELRLITNLTRDGIPRVRLVLCGTMRLEEMLGHPQMESLNQRLACRCYLSPLNQQETLGYLTHKVELCGSTIQSTFTEESMRLIHRATDGVPRLIDQLADQSLRLAAEARQRPVSASIIESAWASLQQLPLPWSDEGTPIVRQVSAIEYGSLADDTENEFSNDEATDSRQSINKTVSESTSLKFAFPSAASTDTPPFERPIASPIPSAGMGLSRVAAPVQNAVRQLEITPEPESVSETKLSTHSEPTLDDVPAYESDPWNDFVQPSESRFEQGPTNDFVEDLFDFSSESSQQPSTLPDTVDYQPFQQSPPYQEAYRQEPFESALNRSEEALASLSGEPTVEQEEMIAETTQPSTSINDLFGSGFDEEVELRSNNDLPVASIPHPADPLQNLSFEINAFSDSFVDNSLVYEDISLQPYTELLDSLSSANLEAMTLDPSDSLSTIPLDATAKDLPSRNDFEGGLSRQTRNSILSFADLQQNQQALVRDDRDLLIIEDDLPTHGSDHDLGTQTPATIHPYKQLFSKLRG